MISTRDLSELPDIDSLKHLAQSLALLDAIICPEWEYRYHSFNAQWASDEYLASMRNGQGDHYFCLFTLAGAVIKGFAHEAPMSPYHFTPSTIWSGILDQLPLQFRASLSETAFAIDETTFCIWRTYSDSVWQIGDIQFPAGENTDGSAHLLSMLDGDPRTYQRWAEGYYGRTVDLDAVTAIYHHKSLTPALIATLNAELSIDDLSADIAEIGYP
ncbi:MAG: hypothetical protein ABI947_16700 [Chloroflexota bacterium]